MAEIKQLREQMAEIATQARAKLDEVTENTPEDRAAEINREFDAMMDDHDKLQEKAERLKKLEVAQRAADQVDLDRRPSLENRSAPVVDDGAKMDYRAAFAEYIAKGGEAYVSPEARNVLMEHRVQTGGDPDAGGYTVPTELATFIEKAMIATGPMYGSELFTVINSANGATFNIPFIDDTSKTAVTHTEGTQPTDESTKDADFGQATLGAFAFNSEWIRWSAELNADSILNMESLLGELIGERLGRIANSKLTTGTGSSDVEGIVTQSTEGVHLAKRNSLTTDEIIDFIHSVDPAYRASATTAIMMNDNTLKAVRKLKDDNGVYLWQMGNIQAGIPQSLLGYNVVINQAMDSMHATEYGKKIMLFGDMSKFYVRKVNMPSLFVARERFAPDYGILGYIRFDGALVNTAAINHMTTLKAASSS